MQTLPERAAGDGVGDRAQTKHGVRLGLLGRRVGCGHQGGKDGVDEAIGQVENADEVEPREALRCGPAEELAQDGRPSSESVINLQRAAGETQTCLSVILDNLENPSSPPHTSGELSGPNSVEGVQTWHSTYIS